MCASMVDIQSATAKIRRGNKRTRRKKIETTAPPPQRGTAPNFRPVAVAAKWLDGSRCHLVGR